MKYTDKFYHDLSLNCTAEVMEFISDQGIELGVESIDDHRFNHTLQRWGGLVRWVGLQEPERSWEPLSGINNDVPGRVREYLQSVEDDEFAVAVHDVEADQEGR